MCRQWVIGVAPCLPGFVASVNSSVTLPDSMRELYMTSYIYGFLSSGVVFALLHVVFPAHAVNNFVKDRQSAAEVQKHYSERWDVSLVQAGHMAGEDVVGGEGGGGGKKESGTTYRDQD